jgi:hypothetical protein
MNGDRPEHDRFDDDLRSVLREETPTDAPTELRQRVAAIPTAMPAPIKPRRRWSLALPLLATAAGAFVLVVAIATLRAGQTPPSGAGSSPSPSLAAVASDSPASTPPSATPSQGPKPSPSASTHPAASAAPTLALAPCNAADLVAGIVGWEGAAGSRIAEVELENTAATCLVPDAPGLRLIDGRGTILIDSATLPSSSPAPSAGWSKLSLIANTQVRVANYCGPQPADPIEIDFVLPGGGTLVAKPIHPASSANAIPPCNGPNGPEIDMNGWTH